MSWHPSTAREKCEMLPQIREAWNAFIINSFSYSRAIYADGILFALSKQRCGFQLFSFYMPFNLTNLFKQIQTNLPFGL